MKISAIETPKFILKKYFGYEEFRFNQESIINSILAGENVLAVLPTGAGKSICYQIPALLSQKYSIVISPLISLMKDQVDALIARNIPAFVINSNTDVNDYFSIKKLLKKNNIKLLYVSPERLLNNYFLELIEGNPPEYVFVDEAHCISQWGHNFRPSYRRIKNFCDSFGITKISAFTATAIPEVVEDISKQLGFKNPKIFIGGFERENLSISTIITKDKKSKLLKILSDTKEPVIIYSATRKSAEEISNFLNLNKISCFFYHGGMTQERRQKVQEDFLNDKIQIISATNAFGMGINKSNVRKIIHYNMPATIESYYQEIGRAGRDGYESEAILFFEQNDFKIQERLIKSTFPFKDEINLIYNLLSNFSKIAIGNRNDKPIKLNKDFYDLLKAKKITEQKFNAALEYFEKYGILIREYPTYLKYYAKLNLTVEQFRGFVESISSIEMRDLLIYLAYFYKESIFHSMTEINIIQIQTYLETTKSSVISKLDKLAETGIADFEKPSTSFQINFLQPRFDPEKSNLFDSSAYSMLSYSLSKLEKMRDFIFTKKCRFEFILNYFGQKAENYKCGKCDNCRINLEHQDYVEFISDIIIDTLEDMNSTIAKDDLAELLLGTDNRIDLWNLKNFSALKFYSRSQILEVLDILKVKNIIAERKGEVKLKTSILNKKEQPDFDKRLSLFNKLREIRHKAAVKFSQPEHLICSDEILLEVVDKLPDNFNRLISINGFNQRMYNKIGEDFLAEIKMYKKEKDSNTKIPEELETIYNLVKRKHSLRQIAEMQKLPETIISVQIETLIKFYPNTDIKSLIPAETFSRIKNILEKGITNIKAVREALNDKVSYAEIRIVKAKLNIH